MAASVHRFGAHDDELPLTVPIPRFEGMGWPGEDEVAHVPVALLLASRGECSCDACCEGFVHMTRRLRLKAV